MKILFINGRPVNHSDDVEDLYREIHNICGEIDVVTYGYHAQVFHDKLKNTKDISENSEWHSGIYGIIGDRYFDQNNEEVSTFILDDLYHSYELRDGMDGYDGAILESRLKEYCEKHNIKE